MQFSLRDKAPVLLAAAILLAAPAMAPGLRAILFMAVAEAVVALGILVLLRAGQISYGHALYFAAGAYAVAFGSRWLGPELLLTLPFAVACSALLGAALGAILVRYRDIFFAMLNLAFSMVGFTLLLKLYDLTGGSDGLTVAQHRYAGLALPADGYGPATYALAVALLALALLATSRYLASPQGQALSALKTNETRLEYLGVSGRAVLYRAYVASAALAGLGGALAALGTGHVTPELGYWTKSAEFVFIAVLGGVGHVAGALAGAVGFELLRSYASAAAANAWQLIMGAVLILIVLFAPQGLCGLVRKAGAARAAKEASA